jgi:Pyruvate/2-oxoacid:ferredoxin oxidoreductase delta subunit
LTKKRKNKTAPGNAGPKNLISRGDKRSGRYWTNKLGLKKNLVAFLGGKSHHEKLTREELGEIAAQLWSSGKVKEKDGDFFLIESDTGGDDNRGSEGENADGESESSSDEKENERADDENVEEASPKDAQIEKEDERADDENVEEASPKDAQISFLLRMIHHWFMTPFTAKDESAAAIGSMNEGNVIRKLPQSLSKLSNKEYAVSGGKNGISEYGLVVRRDGVMCATSPDGVVALQRNGEFYGLAALEIKTKGTRATMGDLEAYVQSSLDGKRFITCEAGTKEFEKAVREPGYRTQIAQHAAVLGLDYALIAYALPGGNIELLVLVRFTGSQREKILKFQTLLAKAHMGFAYSDDPEGIEYIPRIGCDLSTAYSYARDHHTVELWLEIWRCHNDDVISNGLPPPAQKILDIGASSWNHFMGWVDILRKVLKGNRAKYGPAAQITYIMFMVFLDYICNNGFRLYQFSRMEKETHNSYLSFARARRNRSSYQHFLYSLLESSVLEPNSFAQRFPGQRETIEGRYRVATPPPVGAMPPANCDGNERESSVSKKRRYKALEDAMEPNSALYAKRLHGPSHTLSRFQPNAEEPNAEQRKRCVVCCMFCKTGKDHTNRYGALTYYYCNACGVALCRDGCYELFHSPDLTYPRCMG